MALPECYQLPPGADCAEGLFCRDSLDRRPSGYELIQPAAGCGDHRGRGE